MKTSVRAQRCSLRRRLSPSLALLVFAAIAPLAVPGVSFAANAPQPPRIAGTATPLVRFGYFTAAEFFPVDLRRVSDFPVAFNEFDPGKDFGVAFVGAVEAPGRADFTVRGVLRAPDGTPFDAFVETKKYSEHASWYPVRRVFAMERLRTDRRGKWELDLFIDDRPIGKFSFDVIGDPLWAQRPKKPTVMTAQTPPPTPSQQPAKPSPPQQPQQPALVKLEVIGPPNSRLRFDGGREQTLDGRGRIEISAAPGKHRIEVTASGYKPYASDVTLAPDQPSVRQSLALVELAPPTVALRTPAAGSAPVRTDKVKLGVEVRGESRPSALRVFKDGKLLEEKRAPSNLASNQPWVTETAPLDLAEGETRVTLEAVDEFGRSKSQTFTVAREPLVAVELKIEPDAKVVLSNPEGKHEFTADRSGKITARLLPGDYQVAASRPGFKPATEKLTVARGAAVSRVIAMDRVPAPVLAILDPKSGATVQVEQVTLKVEVKSAERLAKLKVSVGGAPAQSHDRDPKAPAGEAWLVSVPVKLAVGENQISLEASDQLGLVTVTTMTLTRESLVALELTGPAGAEVRVNQNRYTLDSRGMAVITLRPGTYDIEASKDGFEKFRDTVTLKPEQKTASQKLGMQIAKATPAPEPPKPAPTPAPPAPPVVAQRPPEPPPAAKPEPPKTTPTPAPAPAPTAPPVIAQPTPAPAPPVVAQPAPTPKPAEPPRVAAVPPTPPPAAPPARVDPPKIQFSYPLADAKLQQEKTTVNALVTDEIGLTEIELTINGDKVPTIASPKEGTPRMSVTVKDVALQMGENVFAITATNKAGKTDQVVRIVTRIPTAVAAAPAAPAPPPQPKGELYAVVIGVGVYDNPSIPRLRFAENDARAVYDLLTTKGGYKKDNVKLITDTTGEKPTLLSIKRALGDWLQKRAGKDDSVFVYYAGHGAPETDASGTDKDGLSKYLIPRDADPESLFVSAFNMDDIETIFRRLHSKRVVFTIDTCFSGGAGERGGRTFSRQTTRSGHMTKEFLERLAGSEGRVVISASGPNELALELPDLKHGLFTYYLLKGLEGEADADKDGIVTVSELFTYVQRHVSTAARQQNGKQSPVMTGAGQDLPIMVVPKP